MHGNGSTTATMFQSKSNGTEQLPLLPDLRGEELGPNFVSLKESEGEAAGGVRAANQASPVHQANK